MDLLFDLPLVTAARARSRNPHRGADFLLELAGRELAERLSVVERHFDEAVELHGGLGNAAAHCLATGKIGSLRRLETARVFAARNAPIEIAALEDVPLGTQSVNLVISSLALHLTNDTPACSSVSARP